MIILAGGGGLTNKRVHRRIKNRFQSDSAFGTVQLRVATSRESGPYRVVTTTDPREFFDDAGYPVNQARLEIGFDVERRSGRDCYWISWVEPARQFLLSWHQDDDHAERGPVHLQLQQSDGITLRERASHIDAHPMAVIEERVAQLPDLVRAVEWDGDTITGIQW